MTRGRGRSPKTPVFWTLSARALMELAMSAGSPSSSLYRTAEQRDNLQIIPQNVGSVGGQVPSKCSTVVHWCMCMSHRFLRLVAEERDGQWHR